METNLPFMAAIFTIRDGLVRNDHDVTVSFTCLDPASTEFKYATVHVMDGQATVSRMINRTAWAAATAVRQFVTEQIVSIEEELAESGTYWSA